MAVIDRFARIDTKGNPDAQGFPRAHRYHILLPCGESYLLTIAAYHLKAIDVEVKGVGHVFLIVKARKFNLKFLSLN
jgi:hypothetical protein